MSNNRFRDAMGQIDDHLLERCEAYEQQLTKKKRTKLWGVITVAACLTVIIGVLLFAPRNEPPERVILLTANDIATLFPQYNGPASFSEITAVYVPDENALGLLSVPEADSLPIFLRVTSEETFGEESIHAFADSILPGVALALGETVPEYTVDVFTRVEVDIGGHNVSVSQSSYLNYFGILRSREAPTTTLSGHAVQIDQSQTDEEIIAGLSDVHRILQDIFGVQLPDVKVIRTYDKDSDYGCVTVRVYFYNKDAHFMNAYTESPISDHIELWFYNDPLFMEEQCSLDVLQCVDISYRDWRTDETEMYEENGMAELLPLHEAEALLEKGYSFGGHRCEICSPILPAVDFTDYDAVSFTYLGSKTSFLTDKPTACIPFYVFYKHVGTAENGNNIYAQAYVPAVHVSGLEEYFQNHHWIRPI